MDELLAGSGREGAHGDLNGRRPLPFCASRDDNAPDFQAEAIVHGQLRTVSLSEYRGHYVLLFFYSSDFTFV